MASLDKSLLPQTGRFAGFRNEFVSGPTSSIVLYSPKPYARNLVPLGSMSEDIDLKSASFSDLLAVLGA